MWFEAQDYERVERQRAVGQPGSIGIPRVGSFIPASHSTAKHQRSRWIQGKTLWLALLLLGLFAAGCTTVSFPPVNLKQPGWTVRQGQAIWHRQRGGAGIAGDILVATRSNGRAFVQFSKTPFPLVVAQSTPKAWTVEFPPQSKHYSGRGQPPERIIFFQLPRVLTGQPLPKHWSWKPLGDGGWRLENNASGESLDVYFNP